MKIAVAFNCGCRILRRFTLLREVGVFKGKAASDKPRSENQAALRSQGDQALLVRNRMKAFQFF